MAQRGHKVVVRESTAQRMLGQSRFRLLCVAFFFLFCYASIALRLVEMMFDPQTRKMDLSLGGNLLPGQENAEDASMLPQQVFSRADIVDRNGEVIATNLKMVSAFANPKEIIDPKEAAQKLEKVLGIPKEFLIKRLSGNKHFVWLKRYLTPKQQQVVNNLGIPGVYFYPEEKRIYPLGREVSQLIGYVGIDNKGLSGVEKTMDRRLTDEELRNEPLALSIDLRVQHIMRDELQKAVSRFSAIGGVGIVMNIKTGEILAMTSLPDFDPNFPSQAKDAERFNRATLGTYEMGSTFKTFTMAMALDYGTANFKSSFDASNPLKIANFTISDAHGKKRWLYLPEVYAYSSNIGTAKILLDAGISRQKEFLRKLGMFQPVEIELPEVAQPIAPREWKEINAVTISYGHGISVTPLHLLRAVAAVTGDGRLPRLTLLRDGNEHKNDGARVVSDKTAFLVRRLMRMVVVHGTGAKADVPGYRVGGKTGTAEKVQASGTYNPDAKLASFLSIFPFDDPDYAILVMVDEPKGDKSTGGNATGGWISAPVVGNVIARMAPLLQHRPELNSKKDDADKYWVSSEPPPAPKPAGMVPGLQPAVAKQYSDDTTH